LAVGNSGDVAEVDDVEIVADPAISAEFVGFSNCVGGCVGLRATSKVVTRRARESISDPLPTLIGPGGDDLRAVIRFSLTEPAASECEYVSALLLRLADGRTIRAEYVEGGWILAIKRNQQVDCWAD
jgi:hypothetical protein